MRSLSTNAEHERCKIQDAGKTCLRNKSDVIEISRFMGANPARDEPSRFYRHV
jgi:hypothetical protein